MLPSGSRRLGLALVSALFFCFLAVPSLAAPDTQEENSPSNANNHPILVELFTSEGCSSCPPADEFLQKLDSQQPIPGAHLIVLSEHVDYWDDDGWKDPHSSHAFTERQEAYVRAFGLSTAYTPQIIVDGSGEMSLDDPHKIEAVFQKAVDNSKIPVNITSVSVDPQNPPTLHAHVEANSASSKADVFVAIALNHVASQVLHGENGGKHLTHVAVVQRLDKVGEVQKGKSFVQDVNLKLKTGTSLGDIRLVAFVQARGPGRMLGAASWKADN